MIQGLRKFRMARIILMLAILGGFNTGCFFEEHDRDHEHHHHHEDHWDEHRS